MYGAVPGLQCVSNERKEILNRIGLQDSLLVLSNFCLRTETERKPFTLSQLTLYCNESQTITLEKKKLTYLTYMNNPLVRDQSEVLDLFPSRALDAMSSHRKGVLGPSFHFYFLVLLCAW